MEDARAYETTEVEPGSPVVGALTSVVDLSRPFGNQTFQGIHDALMDHQVVFGHRPRRIQGVWPATRQTACPSDGFISRRTPGSADDEVRW